jgi:HK97 family phage major capsid protein
MSKSAQQWLEAEVNRHVNEAREITRKAEDTNRELSDDERATIEEKISKVTDLKAQIKQIEDNDNLMGALSGLKGGEGTPTVVDPVARTVGEGFVNSEGFKGWKSRGFKGSTGEVDFGDRFGMKLTDAGLSVESVTAAGGALPLQPQVLPTLGPVEDAITIADLLGQGVATQNSIVYLEETTTQTVLGQNPYSGQSSADQHVVEGAAKPPVFLDFTKRTVAVEKVAAFLPIADEMLEDEPQISSYINSRLNLFVAEAVEAYILGKIYNGNMSVSGGAADIGGNNMFDQIAAGILKCDVVGGLNADTVLIHPTDYWKMVTAKASTSGVYFGSGPFSDPQNNPWGIRAIISRVAPQGSPIVGAFREGATLFRKGGLRVDASNSHSDYFRKDLTALRAEYRIAVAVLRPKAFVKCGA